MKSAWSVLVWAGVSIFHVLWWFGFPPTATAGRIGGLPFADFEALFAEANADNSDDLQLDEFLRLTRTFFHRFSSLDISQTDVEENVAPRAFLRCDRNRNGALSLVEFTECTDHHYLYGQWIDDGHAAASSVWPPQLQQVQKFDPRDAVELQKGLQHFWKHGFSVFRALSATELNHAKVLTCTHIFFVCQLPDTYFVKLGETLPPGCLLQCYFLCYLAGGIHSWHRESHCFGVGCLRLARLYLTVRCCFL